LLFADGGGVLLYEHTKNCYQSLKKLHKFKNFSTHLDERNDPRRKNNQFSKPEEQILSANHKDL
jgi:hypothetical protein